MIISSAPLRLSLNGGGSDLPAFTKHHAGRVISVPLDKRVYITLHYSFDNGYRVAYSKIENCRSIDQIQHKLVRFALEKVKWDGPGLEITSIADVPSTGTGLGASSAFTVALLNGLYHLKGEKVSKNELANAACEVEILLAKEPIGMQDQYASAFGGLNQFDFLDRFNVLVEPIFLGKSKEEQVFLDEFNRSLLFFHVNLERNANTILEYQSKNIDLDTTNIDRSLSLVELATKTRNTVILGDFETLGTLMTKGWEIKCELNGDNKDPVLMDLLNWVKNSGIYGGKLLGAGGGGFLALLAHPSKHEMIRSDLGNRFREYNAKIVISGPTIQTIGA